MQNLRRSLAVVASAAGLVALSAAPASAIVGGQNAPAGKYTSVAKVTFGAFSCTGTLIAPTWVLTAGHCGSITGGTGYGVPAAWPAAMINVRIGGHNSASQTAASVKRAIVHPNYLLGAGYDITLLELTAASPKTPTQVAGPASRGLWDAGDVETIAGWGVTKEGGSAPSTLQEANVPITTDAYCANAYDEFEANTQVCAGYPQGGVDTCQGDSGGPMFGGSAPNFKVVGATSYGYGCARPNYPGVYARVADTTLRTWIAGYAPAGVGS